MSKKHPPKNRGPSHWISDSKILFFSRHRDQWLQAKENNKLQLFAETMASRYNLCYGHLPTLQDDLPGHVTPPVPTDEELRAHNLSLTETLQNLSVEERATRDKQQKALREKILRWYREHTAEKVADRKTDIPRILDHLFKSHPPPRRGQAVQTYTNVFWDEGVGDAVQTAYWSALEDAAVAVGDDAAASLAQAPSTPPSAPSDDDDANGDDDSISPRVPAPLLKYDPKKKKYLSVLHAITRQMYEDASDEDKEIVAEEIERRYQKRLAEYKAVQKPVENYEPGDYAIALAEGARYVEQLARVFASHFGMCCSIILVDPDDKGNPKVQSVHAGTSKVSGANWPSFDPVTWKVVEASFVKFGSQVFPDGVYRKDLVEDHTSNAKETRAESPSASPPASASDNDAFTPPSGSFTPASTVDKAFQPSQVSRPTTRASSRLAASTPVGNPTSVTSAPAFNAYFSPSVELIWELSILLAPDRDTVMRQFAKMSIADLEQQNSIARSNWLARGSGLEEIPSVFSAPRGRQRTSREMQIIAELRAVLEYEHQLKLAEAWPTSTEARASSPPSDDSSTAMDIDPASPRISSPPPLPPSPTVNDHTTSPPNTRKRKSSVNDIDDDPDNEETALSWDDVDQSGWSNDVVGMFTACKRIRDLSTKWLSTVHSAIVFERRHGFQVRKDIKLGGTSRPKNVATFFKNAHAWRTTFLPKEPIVTHKAMWWKWWRELQPESRFEGQDRTGALLRRDDTVWNDLPTKCGQNGLVSVIGSLLWWREGISADTTGTLDKGVEHLDWERAVEDVGWALDHMIRHAVKKSGGTQKVAKRRR